MTPPPAAPPDDAAPAALFRITRREFALIGAFWALFALLTVANRFVGYGAAGPGAPAMPGPESVLVAFGEALCWALLTPPIFRLASRFDADRDTRHQLLLVALFVLVGIAMAAAVTLAGHELRGVLLGPDRGAPRPPGMGPAPLARRGPPWFAFANALLTFGGVLAAGLARAYSLRLRVRREHAVRLEAQLAEARLDALRRQLDPHFLFNTLHAVSALVERDPRGVRRMIARLSELLRHSIEGAGAPEVTLREELALLGRYVDIMQVRFQGRLAVETHAEPRALDALVPTLVLQPLVENAIRHGVEKLAGPGRVVVSAALDGDDVVLRVRDNGPGPRGDVATARGVGVRNTVARLAELYGAAARFSLAPADGGGTEAEIRVPHRRGADTAVDDAEDGGDAGDVTAEVTTGITDER